MIRPTIPQSYIPRLSYCPVLINEIPASRLRRIHNAVSAVFYVENAAPEDVAETIDVLIDILKEEVPEVCERFTEWFASYLVGEGLDIAVDQPIRDLQEVKAMFATKFQEYSRRLKEEGLEKGLEKGLEQGQTAERLAIARRLLDRGEPVETVAELTGLSVDEVRQLANR